MSDTTANQASTVKYTIRTRVFHVDGKNTDYKYIDLSDFGVDVTGNKSSAEKNSQAIAAALDAAHKEGVAIYFPKGTIHISETIKVDKSRSGVTALLGDGRDR